MRVTNAMMTNTTLININRNMRYLDKLIRQIESTKKISVPSDDPIIASRALKFRTNVSETEQFQRNVQSGLAWMNVSESSFINVIENLLKQFRERCVEGATGTETSQDKAALVAEMRELLEQIGVEMNQTYAGRYVFSGYRTDQPAVLTDDNELAYRITQHFSLTDIEKTKSYQKVIDKDENGDPLPNIVITDVPIVNDINVLKLAYKNVENLSVVQTDTFGSILKTYNVETKHSSAIDAYTPPDDGNTIYYIPETGELVMGNTAAKEFSTDGVSVTYERFGFSEDELNPLAYFTCTALIDDGSGNFIDGKSYNMDDQEMKYEFSTNTYVTVNSLAKDFFTDKMYADLLSICDFADSLTISDRKLLEDKYANPPHNLTDDDLKKAVDDQLAEETSLVQSVLYDRFNNMLATVDRHAERAMTEHTEMGSRMHRLELLQTRLEQDENTYTQLLADNEDADLVKAMILKSAAESAYQASLKASANIMQMTLANFI